MRVAIDRLKPMLVNTMVMQDRFNRVIMTLRCSKALIEGEYAYH